MLFKENVLTDSLFTRVDVQCVCRFGNCRINFLRGIVYRFLKPNLLDVYVPNRHPRELGKIVYTFYIDNRVSGIR